MSDIKSDKRKRDTLQVTLVAVVAAVWVGLTIATFVKPGIPIPSIYHALMVGVVIWVATGSFPNIFGRGRDRFHGDDRGDTPPRGIPRPRGKGSDE